MSTEWFLALTEWIKNNGGQIHRSLILKQHSSDDRGIFAHEDISKGTLLIRLPERLAFSGESLPLDYKVSAQVETENDKSEEITRIASPWLRSIAALLTIFLNKESEEYTASLPASYETLLHESSWSDDEVYELLSGTSVGKMVLHDRQSNMLRSRFNTVVKPYLSSNGLVQNRSDDEIYSQFKMACACVSTRGFHLKSGEGNDNDHNISSSPLRQERSSYSGPYLLPFIDLLNHTSNRKQKCTTLQRQNPPKNSTTQGMNGISSQAAFVMVAERDISKGEEIFHSYGDNMAAAQLLQTFGFVEDSLVQRALALSCKDEPCHGITPCVLSRDSVIDACRGVASSNFVNDIKQKILTDPTLEDFDEWDLPTSNDINQRNVKEVKDHISEEIIINYDHPLSDELITLCCVQFLPAEAYDEIFDGESSDLTILSEDILEDFFLGNLVLKSIQCAIEKKVREYNDIDTPASSQQDAAARAEPLKGMRSIQSTIERDQNLLTRLVHNSSQKSEGENAIQMKRLTHSIYGLTIRIEEMTCLQKLEKKCRKILVRHVEGILHPDIESNDGDDNSSKRIKL